MPISIKNSQTELLARKLAELREARSARSMAADLNEIALRCARRPILSNLSPDEILGYDQAGAPTSPNGRNS